MGDPLMKLAVEVDGLQKQLTTANSRLDGQARILKRIGEQVGELVARPVIQQPVPQAESGIVEWFTVASPTDAINALNSVQGWVQTVWNGYDKPLNRCWPWHPGVVEELIRAEEWWRDSFQAEGSKSAMRVDWMNRIWPGARQRVRELLPEGGLGACDEEYHMVGKFQFAYDLGKLDEYADWWARTHSFGPVEMGPPPGLTQVAVLST